MVYVVGIGAFLGCLSGLVAAYTTVSSNNYLHTGFDYVAAKVLWAQTLEAAGTGAVIAVGAIIVGLLSLPATRLLTRGWRYGLAGAIAAPFVLVVLAAVAYYVNHHFLPGIWQWQSVVANIGFAVAAVVVWLLAARTIAPVLEARALRSVFFSLGVISLFGAIVAIGLSRVPLFVAAAGERDASKPMANVLIIMVDTLRPDRMSAYGYERPTTPTVEMLAEDAIVFERAFAQAPWTKPSVASLFTGLYPRQHGVASADWTDTVDRETTRVDTLPPGVTTIAEVLSNVGYSTFAVGSNHHLIRKMGFSQGFDSYEMDLDKDEHGTRSGELNDLFMNWLRGNADASFFAYLHYLDVHWPFTTPPPYRGMYAEGAPSVDYNRPKFGAEFNASGAELSPTDLQHMLDSYDEGIVYVDEKIGEVLAELKRLGLYEDTMIVFVADHGEEFTERGKLGHGQSLYDELLHVPLIVKFPCEVSGCRAARVNTLVELIDVMPTILETVGAQMPPDTMAETLPLDDSGLVESFAISEMGEAISLRTPQQKFIIFPGREETYDLVSDPKELTDLGNSKHPVLADLRERLISAVDAMDEGFSVEREVVELDEDSRRKLEALGYVE
jgi:arylsulfatase A-like enzyme